MLIASGGAPAENGMSMPMNFTETPLTGEVSRWMSRIVGYAALIGAGAAVARMMI